MSGPEDSRSFSQTDAPRITSQGSKPLGKRSDADRSGILDQTSSPTKKAKWTKRVRESDEESSDDRSDTISDVSLDELVVGEPLSIKYDGDNQATQALSTSSKVTAINPVDIDDINPFVWTNTSAGPSYPVTHEARYSLYGEPFGPLGGYEDLPNACQDEKVQISSETIGSPKMSLGKQTETRQNHLAEVTDGFDPFQFWPGFSAADSQTRSSPRKQLVTLLDQTQTIDSDEQAGNAPSGSHDNPYDVDVDDTSANQPTAPGAYTTPSLVKVRSPAEQEFVDIASLVEEQRQAITDREVARYLSATGNIMSFEQLMNTGLLSQDVLNEIEALDAALLDMIGQFGPPDQTQDAGRDSLGPSHQQADYLVSSVTTDDGVVDVPGPSGKGKGRARSRTSTLSSTNEGLSINAYYVRATTEEIQSCLLPGQAVQLKCGICFDAFTLSPSPRLASQMCSETAGITSSFGICLSCPGMHNFCLDCLSEYVRVTVTGPAPFPVRCPECPRDCLWEIDDETAGLVLDAESLEKWYRQKLLSGPGMIFCPNSRCSELVELPEMLDDEIPVAECPYCTCSMCYKCRSLWHADLTCEEAQLLEQNQSPEDKLFYLTAKKAHYRRCPKCRMVLERTAGCNHMSCVCGAQFCWMCGAVYGPSGCNGNCATWKHDMTLITSDPATGMAGPSGSRPVSRARRS